MTRIVVNMRDPRPLWSIPDWAVDEIRRAVPTGYTVHVVGSLADGRGDGGGDSVEAIEAIAEAEIYLGFGFSLQLFASAKNGADRLKWIHSGAAGVGGALHQELVDSPIDLTNSAGVHAEPIADTVMAMVYYFARGLDLAVKAQRERRWDRDGFDSLDTMIREIAGSTAGIIGYGGIGRAVAVRAQAAGMRVLAYARRERPADDSVELLFGETGLERILAESRFVILSLPRTDETEYLLRRERLALLRRDAVVINVGRGELIDEDALIETLSAGAIRGAGLDVFVREPLPPDSPFWRLPNVLVTPHVSATTDQYWRRETDLIVENLGRYSRGKPLRNLVDKRAGY